MPPEIHRLDLAEMVLNLKKSGIDDLSAFPWFEAPDPETLRRATELLQSLGALEIDTEETTEIGDRMTAFPVPPRYARILVEAERTGRGWLDACLLVALAQGRSLFPEREGGRRRPPPLHRAPRHLGLFYPWPGRSTRRPRPASISMSAGNTAFTPGRPREAGRLMQMLDRLSDATPPDGEGNVLADLILIGFPDQVAARRTPTSKVFDVTGGRCGQLSAETVLGNKTRLVVSSEITEIEGKEVNVILSLATSIGEEDLRRHFPGALREEQGVFYHSTERRVVAERRLQFRDLVLERRQSGEPPEDAAAALLAEQVFQGELLLKQWNHAVKSWLARVECIRKAMPELELPEFTGEDHRLLLTEICRGARTYKQVKDRPVLRVVKDWLSPTQRAAVESFAPEQVVLSNGTRAKVDYVTDPEPSVSVILQRLYDVNDTPTIADRRVTLLVKILAPNQRPAQVTKDLRGFWDNSYAAVKTQLKGRYPKHEWR